MEHEITDPFIRIHSFYETDSLANDSEIFIFETEHYYLRFGPARDRNQMYCQFTDKRTNALETTYHSCQAKFNSCLGVALTLLNEKQ